MTDVQLSAFYHSSVNEVTKPNSLVFVSHYFVDRWMPELGPTATAILVCLRSHCYHNRTTNEMRDSVQISLPQIAKEIGVSYKTVHREIAFNKALQKFIRKQPEFINGKTPESLRRDANTYQIAMDDPIHPKDDEKLIGIVQRKAETQDKGTVDAAKMRARQKPLGQIVPTIQRQDKLAVPPGQNVPTPGDKESRLTGQIVPTLIVSSESQENISSVFAPSSASDSSLALFEEKKVPDKTPWTALTEEERQPHIDQATKELLTIHRGSGITPKPKLIEVRAKNIYEASLKAKEATA